MDARDSLGIIMHLKWRRIQINSLSHKQNGGGGIQSGRSFLPKSVPRSLVSSLSVSGSYTIH